MAGTTWNPSDKDSAITLSNGNLTAENTSGLSANKSARAVDYQNSGKYYFEVVIGNAGGGSPEIYVGLSNSSDAMSGTIGGNASSYAYRVLTGSKRTSASNAGYGAALTTGDVLGVAVDFTAGAIWFSKNGTWQASASLSEVEAGTTTHAAFTGVSASLAPSITINDAAPGPIVTLRSSSGDITGTVPSGFTAGWPPPPATTHGDGSVTMPLVVAVTGKVSPTHGAGALTMPMVVAATGVVSPIHGAGAVSMPLVVAAHGVSPGKGQVALSMPLVVAATGTVGVSGTFNASMPNALGASMYGVVAESGTFDADLGLLGADMMGSVGVVGTIDSTLDGPESDLAGLVAVVGVIGTDLGELGAALVGYVPITGTITGALGILGAQLVGVPGAGETWHVIAMNLKTGAITEYESFAFNSMIEWDGAYYGANDSGIFQISGDLDDTVEIDAYARTARTDHESDITKRASDVYLLATSAKRMVFRVIADGEAATVYEYSVPTNLHTGMDAVKSDLGRGLRARYFQYEFANVDGADFECDGFDVVVEAQERRRKR